MEDLDKKLHERKDLSKYIKVIQYKLDKDFMKKWMLLLAKEKDLKKMKTQYQNTNLLQYLQAMKFNMEKTYTGDSPDEDIDTNKKINDATLYLTNIELFIKELTNYLNGNKNNLNEITENIIDYLTIGDQYFFSPDNKSVIMQILPTVNVDDYEESTELVLGIDALIQDLKPKYKDLTIGMTGTLAIMKDELKATEHDFSFPALVALLLIIILFTISFKQIRTTILAVISLIFGITLDIGILGVTFGELNQMSSMFGIALIGLGIDFGIHMISGYTEFRSEGNSKFDALSLTLTKSGFGIIVGAITTAIAFYTLMIFDLKGFRQFGFLLGNGLLTILLAMLTLLPALILTLDRKKDIKVPKINIDYKFIPAIARIVIKIRWTVIIVCSVISLFIVISLIPNENENATESSNGIVKTINSIPGVKEIKSLFSYEFEYSMMELEPVGAESVVFQYKVLDAFEMSPDYALLTHRNINTGKKITDELEPKAIISYVDSIAQYIPIDIKQDKRLKIISEINNQNDRNLLTEEQKLDKDQYLEEFKYVMEDLEANVIEMGQLVSMSFGENCKLVRKRNNMIHEVLGYGKIGKRGDEIFEKLLVLIEQNPDQVYKKLMFLNPVFATKMNDRISEMSEINRKIKVKDLPKSIKSRFINSDGNLYLTYIFPKDDIWNEKHLRRFDEILYDANQYITGTPNLMLTLIDISGKVGKFAVLIALIVIVILLALYFRRIGLIIAALIPLVIGLLWMIGIIGLFGVKFNILNVCALPIILGIGVDTGVHINHRFKSEGRANILNVFKYTGKAVFISSLTTIFGFGTMAVMALHLGLASFGLMLSIGITSCLVVSLLLLPTFLSFYKK